MAFTYRPRTREEAQKRVDQSGSSREVFIKDKYKTWTPKEGENRVRIMPPTWENATHYGLDVFCHYSIGLEGSAFVCLASPPTGRAEDCPLCDARKKAADNGEDELAKALRPNKRVCAWIIDRDKESEGPQIWPMPWTVDKDLANLVVDDRGTGVYAIDDPDKGYDVIFKRTGTGTRTKYEGLRIAREESYLASDSRDQNDWLDYIEANPLTDTIIIATPERLADEFAAGGIRTFEDRQRDGGGRERGRDDRGRDDGRSRDRGRVDDRGLSRGRDDDRGRADDRSRDDRGRERERERPRTPEKPRNYDELERLSEDEMLALARSLDIRLDDRKSVLVQLADELRLTAARDTRRDERPRDDDGNRLRDDDRGRGRDDDRGRERERPREDDRRPREDDRRPREDERGGDREGDRTNRLRAGVDSARERERTEERPRDETRRRL